jgi:gamma-glutamyltranspeptidase/glutathione hydrolase
MTLEVTTRGTDSAPPALRPNIAGTRHVISAGHYLAAEAGFQILEAGGNAVDAGVAAGIALGVVQSDYVNIAGVAPIMIYLAAKDEVVTISGLGPWPAAATLELFVEAHGGAIPEGLLRSVVPAAPDAWITALETYGTLSFAEVAAAAIRFARDGIVMYPLMNRIVSENAEGYAAWPSNSAIYLPEGRPPKVGELFVQSDLAKTLQYMADQEAAARSRGRSEGLKAARDAFYRGDIARTIVAYHEANGGLMTLQDLAGFSVEIEPSVSVAFRDTRVHACGPWCQGPVLLQMLQLLDTEELRGLGHNSLAYAHGVIEAMKLAFADRDAHYRDPHVATVPLGRLLSDDYAAQRRALIRSDRAADHYRAGDASPSPTPSPLDTSYVCVVDADGNAFSATPSDVSHDTPVIPGTGLCPSSRGSQSWAVPGHPRAVAPGSRPRLTPNPAMLIDERRVLPFGTPGGDMQCQAMLQMLLNIELFGMPLQEAIEAPRFATHDFPNSFEPHEHLPGRVNLEGRIAAPVGEGLAALGHDVEWWPDWTHDAGGLCAASRDLRTGLVTGAADPRRPSYALAW